MMPTLLRLLLCLIATSAWGKTVYVNQDTGDDRLSGTAETVSGGNGPLKTFAKALPRLEPGDTLSVAPTKEPYREEMELRAEGTPESPIIIEGNGATIDLGEDISEGPWTEVDGYWSLPVALPREKQAAFAFYRGVPIARLRGTLKEGEVAPDFSAQDGPNETTLIKMPDGLKPPFKGMYKPGGNRCIYIAGAKHVLIRNIDLRGAANDGFGFHGDVVGVVVENSSAVLCGDEGTSAHGKGEAQFIDCLFAWNGSYSGGVTDVHETATDYTRCISAFGRGTGYSLRGAKHRLLDSYALGNEQTETKKDLPPQSVEQVNFVEISDPTKALDEVRRLAPTNPMMARLLELSDEIGWGQP